MILIIARFSRRNVSNLLDLMSIDFSYDYIRRPETLKFFIEFETPRVILVRITIVPIENDLFLG